MIGGFMLRGETEFDINKSDQVNTSRKKQLNIAVRRTVFNSFNTYVKGKGYILPLCLILNASPLRCIGGEIKAVLHASLTSQH
jgi:hypothetical protein